MHFWIKGSFSCITFKIDFFQHMHYYNVKVKKETTSAQ